MPSTARESVLIVEGDPAAAAVERCLRAAGVPVRYAHGVAPACTLLRAESVSTVIAVLGRAEAGALAVIRAAARARPAAPVVVYLPRGSECVGAERAAVRAAAFTVLEGPCEEEELVEQIDAARAFGQGGVSPEPLPAAPDGHDPLAQLERYQHLAEWLGELAALATSGASLDAIAEAAAEAAVELADAREAWVVRGAEEHSVAYVAAPDTPGDPPPVPVELVRAAIESRGPVSRPADAPGRGGYGALPLAATRVPSADAPSVRPLDRQPEGALALSFPEGHELTRPVAALLALLARSLAGVLRTVEQSHQATQACDDALRVLAGTLALTDAQTAAPLAEVAASLARELDIPTGAPETAELWRAATLRAAGGEELAASLGGSGRFPALGRAAALAAAAGERWDGSGPAGLRGETIPRAARALAAAEGWIEAGGQGVEAALAALEMGSGARYDPAAVQAAARLVRRGELTAAVTPQAGTETGGEGWRAVG
jgi:response regulator RpfG family c-di-GMP phosphodiesterase